jgi:hypothetical protein
MAVVADKLHLEGCSMAMHQHGGADVAPRQPVMKATNGIMRRLGLSKAFTNDGHFRAAGFETLF